MEIIAGIDVTTFKGKALAIADAINAFCEKLGITVNEFIATPAGNILIVGVVYKMGIFGSLWAFTKGSLFTIFLVWMLIQINSKKKIVIEMKDADGKVIKTSEEVVPKFNAVTNNFKDEQSVYAVISSVICFIALCIINM